MNLAIPVREPINPWDESPRLRYCLRAWLAHAPVKKIVIVGHIPNWLQTHPQIVTVPTFQRGSKFANIGTNLEAALSVVPENFVWTNDDIFPLYDISSVPLYASGPIDTRIRDLDDKLLKAQGEHKAFLLGMAQQRDLAREWGYDTATTLCTDLHLPIPLKKSRLKKVIERRNNDAPEIEPGHFRMLYGLGLKATVHKDVKKKGLPLPNDSWISTSPASWSGETGKYLKLRYHVPAEWEA